MPFYFWQINTPFIFLVRNGYTCKGGHSVNNIFDSLVTRGLL